MAHTSLERQLLAAQATKLELETKLREKDISIERLEKDRRWLAEREEKEREEKLQEQSEREEEKVCHFPARPVDLTPLFCSARQILNFGRYAARLLPFERISLNSRMNIQIFLAATHNCLPLTKRSLQFSLAKIMRWNKKL
jgi:hypothetical protein